MANSSSLTNHTASNYTQHAHFVYSDKYTSPVLDQLNAQPGETIIDLGCGTGQLTQKLKAAVGSSGTVYGVDSSTSMVCN
jgi:ubiquinone/menaquinone biosynthesis C-methylase UbiE